MASFPVEITKIDRILLAKLQNDARVTLDELAVAAGLSTSSAQRRLARLRETKVIQREITVLNAKALGYGITLLVELEIEHHRPELMPILRSWISAKDEIQSAWHITGSSDLLLVIIVATIEAFDALMERLMTENRSVKKYTTSVALKTLKQGLTVPV